MQCWRNLITNAWLPAQLLAIDLISKRVDASVGITQIIIGIHNLIIFLETVRINIVILIFKIDLV